MIALCAGVADGARTKFACLIRYNSPSGLSFAIIGAIFANASSSARASAWRRCMKRQTLAVALVATLCGLIAAPALAQNAAPATAAPAKPKPKPKPKTPAGAPTATVTVTNARKADLVQLQAAESGSANWKKVLGALKPGKQASAQVPRSFNCRVDLHGTFADGQSMDASDIDVCAQKTLNLTE
jgi:hypothetical protein